MARSLKALVVNDNTKQAESRACALRRFGFEVTTHCVKTVEGYLSALGSCDWNVVLSEYTMAEFSAMEALRLLRESQLDIPFIVVSATAEEETVADCMKRGADDCIIEGDLARLGPSVEHALDLFEQKRERARLEEQLRHAQRLEMTGMLAGAVAHDFMNLLTAISGSADLLKADVAPTGRARAAVETIEQAVKQAANVTRSLLTFSHGLPSEKKTVDLRAIVTEVSGMLRRALPASIEFAVDVTCDQPLWVNADRIQLQQVVLSLAVHARDAMRGGGSLRISLHSLSDSAASNSGSTENAETAGAASLLGGLGVRMVVRHTGKGISPDVRRQIPGPPVAPKPGERGVGSLLANVHNIVRDHSGVMDIEPTPEQGTCFVIDLPRIDPRVTEPAAVAEPHRGRSETILVVESQPYARQIVASSLNALGYHVLQADNDSTMFQQYAVHHRAIRLLVIDADLPTKGGQECLRRLRRNGARTPAILTSGGACEAVDLQTVVLSKPFRPSALGRLVGDMLTGQLDQAPQT